MYSTFMLSLFVWLLRQDFVFPYLYETAHLSQTLSKLELAVQHFYMDGVLITLCCYKVTACGNRFFLFYHSSMSKNQQSSIPGITSITKKLSIISSVLKETVAIKSKKESSIFTK